MKIKTKLLLGLYSLPVLLIILMIMSLTEFFNLNKMNNSLLANYELTHIAEQTQVGIKEEGIYIRNLVIFDDPNVLQTNLSRLQDKSDLVSRNIDILESKANTEQLQLLIKKLNNTKQKFESYKDNLIEYVFDGKKEKGIQLINDSSFTLQSQFSQDIFDITTSLENNLKESSETTLKGNRLIIIFGACILAICIILTMLLQLKTVRNLIKRLNQVSSIMSNVANGNVDLNTKVEVLANDEIDDVANSFNRMSQTLNELLKKEQDLTWTKSNIADITTSLSNKSDLKSLAQKFLSKVAPLVDSSHAVLYVKEVDDEKRDPVFHLLASYAFKERNHLTNTIRLGEGLIGQAALENSPIILTNVPADYIRINSGLGEAKPLNVYVLPISFEGEVKAILEIASFNPYSTAQQMFLEELLSNMGIILESVEGRMKLAKLLEESQALMEEVQAQSEELQSQQEELRATNEELEEQTQALRQSEEKLQSQQEELEQSNADLEEKAKSLEEQNKKIELTNREVERARAELEEKAKQLALSSNYKSEFLANISHELRTPLNSLLILSKLLIDNKNDNLTVKQVEYARTIYSSGKDLLLLINDILDLAKIESGKMDVNPVNIRLSDVVEFVESSFRPIANEKNLGFDIILKDDLPLFINSDEVRLQQVLRNLLSNAFKFTKQGKVSLEMGLHSKSSEQTVLSFSITDTGIGISKEKQELIFQAFQQADGSTSRKYGGTGLGLSICREIAVLVGGEIVLNSELGKGSTFTYHIGDYLEGSLVQKDEVAAAIENDQVKTHFPLEKSVTLEFIQPPIIEVSPIKKLLIVEDDVTQRNSLMEMIGNMDVVFKAVSSGHEAIEQLKVSNFDCIVLDLVLTDINGFDVLEKIVSNDEMSNIKVFVYTGRNLTSKEELYLNRYAHTIIIKDEQAPQRLKAELELYLNGNNVKSEVSNKLPREMNDLSGLEGKRVLIVDDDVRNVYALSNILELYGIEVTFVENGLEGVELLKSNSNFDLILMDIMMPEMDGYEAMQRIRVMPIYENLPIIALTAKAMKEDRDKCMEAGASDYIVKPVDPDQLMSLIKVWLYQ